MKRMIAALAVLLLAGCAAVQPRGDAPVGGLERFETLATDDRVRYEPGAQPYAERVAELLSAAVAQVEAGHYRPFAGPVIVHVCGSAACFERELSAGTRFTAAVLYDNRVLLAPRLFDREPSRLYPILVHELSHLHLGQRLGHYTMRIPVWFHEGLASLVASGGGADLVDEEEARRAIAAGEHFLPDATHDETRRKYADHWRLRIGMLYRQSMMFLAHLRAAGEERFRDLLEDLQQRASFDGAFSAAFGAGALELAQRFLGGLGCPRPACGAPAASP
jgi:hypothetical protein